ncbi:MAG: Ig-like domain-containing protein [Candidatus Poribacteria bacterium]|nr:Ig-like domain-containing protein [Candidatus Poribacteria bacterium]
MKKQLIGFIFLFFGCLLMPFVAKADFDIDLSRSHYPRTITPAASMTFTVKVQEDGRPVSGQTVTFSVTPNAELTADEFASLSPTSATTDSNGEAQTTLSLTGDTSAHQYVVRATLDNGQSDTKSVPVGVASGGAELSLAINNLRTYHPGESAGFTFWLHKGVTGVPGKTVTFSVSPNDGTASLSTTSATTDSNGEARTKLILGSNASGSYNVTATLDDGKSVSNGIPSVYNSTLPSGFILAMRIDDGAFLLNPGGNRTFTAIVQDNGYISGQTVTFSVSPNDGTVSLSSTTGTTNSNGEASTSLITGSGSSGTYTVTATLANGQSVSGTATIGGSSSPPPTDPNPDPPPEVIQIPQEQRATPEGPTGNTGVPAGPTGNTPAQQAAPESSTGNTSPASTGPTGNTQGTPPSVLVVSIPTLSKTVLDSGESFTISVTVENTSESLSPETILRYYRSSDISMSGTEVGKNTVSPIAAMGTSDVSISLTAPDAPGTYLYYACISSVTGGSNTGNTCTPNSVQLTVRGESQDTSEPQGTSKYDVNGDGAVDIEDAALVAGAFGTSTAKYDVDGNGLVDVADLLLIITNRQEAASAPSVVGMKFTATQMDRIQVQVALLASTNDRSLAAMQTLAYLRSLIAVARPEKTQLLANYPNPFNPETWIPYRLAAAANVTLTIYDINGQVVRTLALGHQAAGIYQTRNRAAYWDGRNAFGEPVASGVYFYMLTAGEFTATRRMVILK